MDPAGNFVSCSIHDSDTFLVATKAESTFVLSPYVNMLKGIIEMVLEIFNNLSWLGINHQGICVREAG